LFQIEANEKNHSKYFNEAEKNKTKEALVNFTDRIKLNFEPNSESLLIINSKLDYLKDTAERLDKFDWQGIALLTIISISIALSLDTDRLLFQAFREYFKVVTKLISS
jgi:hypothetical protein